MKRQWLIDIRGKRTQEDIAKEASISRSYYTQIETGMRNPSVPIAKAIAQALGIEWTLFFEENCSVTEHKRKTVAM